VDLSIWGPHGIRIQKAMKLSGLIMSPGGELVQHEYKGPPDIEHWAACWEVFATAMIMLGACSPPYLLAYGALIAHYARRYGQKCWALIYQMETRFRREMMERARRRASTELDRAIVAGHLTEFDPLRPWDYVFMKAVEEHKYWHTNVEEPALLIITGSRSPSGFLDGDATIADNSMAHIATYGSPGFAFVADSGARSSGRASFVGPPASDRRPPVNDQPPKRHAPAQNNSDPRPMGAKGAGIGPDGRYLTNRKGHHLCVAFNRGECKGNKVGNPVCPVDATKRHNCSICMGFDHGAQQCKASVHTGSKKYGKGK
jgi:hypothetical protein